MKLGEFFRQLQGKQRVSSRVIGQFALFPKPDEQEKICDYGGKKLGKFLRDYPDIAAMAAYDVVFALDDKNKATELLAEVSSHHGSERIKSSLYVVNVLRIKDQAPETELAAFGQFCAQAGFNFAELTKTDVREAIVSDQITSAVKLHVDRIS
ncbi:MAG: hypothetical protein AAB856_03710 [Patescibacteria group bacterium]